MYVAPVEPHSSVENDIRDIAIVQLKEDVDEGDPSAQPACLPQPDEPVPKGVRMYGWGYTNRALAGCGVEGA